MPVDVKSSVPLEVKITPASVAALGGDAVAAAAAHEAPATGVGPGVPSTPAAPQATTTTTTTAPLPVPVAKADNLTLMPTTTAQEDVVTAGQRHINRVWEYSQAAIALMITAAIVYCAINEINSDELSNGFFLIIGFYFSRANHSAIGGVGRKPLEGPYQGR